MLALRGNFGVPSAPISAGLRQWIAAAVAFGFALHALLIPLANGKPVPWEAGANGALFVICHGAGGNSGGDQDQPTEQPQQ